MTVRALILSGEGIHCELETAGAFRLAGFETEIRHVNDLISERTATDTLCSRYAVTVFPGGRSFGDDLSAGKILALKLLRGLQWDLNLYSERGGLVLGICNGFQTLIRMGVFGKDLSITQNLSGKFMDAWLKVTPSGTRCIWLKGVGTLELPVRHSDGRIVIAADRRSEALGKMDRHGMLCLRYEENPNGSDEGLAGLCDARGRIFGLMPHPEAFIRWTQHPEWTAAPARASAPGQGLTIFENAFQEATRAR